MKKEKSNFNKAPFILIILIILAILVGPSAIEQMNNPKGGRMTIEDIIAKMYGQDDDYIKQKTQEVKNKQKDKRIQNLKKQIKTIGKESLVYYVMGLSLVVLGIILWGTRDIRKAKKIAKGYQCPQAPPEENIEENKYKKYIEEIEKKNFDLEKIKAIETKDITEKTSSIEKQNKEKKTPSSNLEDAFKELNIISLEDLKSED